MNAHGVEVLVGTEAAGVRTTRRTFHGRDLGDDLVAKIDLDPKGLELSSTVGLPIFEGSQAYA